MSRARVVAVFGAMQGTGVLVSRRLVLTAAHLVRSGEITIAHPHRSESVPADIEALYEEHDLAVLRTAHDVIPEVAPALGRLRFGALATYSALPHCEILGFPDIQRFGHDRRALELDQYRCTVLPVAGSIRSTLVCELDHPAAAEREDGSSPLQGLSGSPVFAGPVLLGIVTDVPRGRDHLRVEGVLTEHIMPMPGVRRSVRVEPITDFHPADRLFEEEYAQAIRARYRKTRIFGIDELGSNESTWDLDTAYLSLEAMDRGDRDPRDPFTTATPPRRIDDLLAERLRTLLRGDAGAGKTTLVWWLASHAACGTLGTELDDLNGLVPLVVPLRALRAQGLPLPGPAQLPAVAGVLADDPPPGWANRVLKAGRGFLLIDGLDEVPAAEREETRVWLSELLSLHPRTRCLATVRPLAVEEEWLGSEGFAELQLLPMRDEDISAFVAAWHRAARLDGSAPDDLDALETDLLAQFKQNEALRTLAQTPLLCAVICALHRRRGGLLPDTRWELYRATLAMLLGSRDSQRKIRSPEGIDMGFDECQELLQSIAIWQVRGAQAQLSRQDAEHQVEAAMRRLPQVRAQGSPAVVLTHLLNRSGLLQERADDEIQFIHRTFQDYLAARALVEGGCLPELIQHAHEEQWRDTVLLAVGHCRPNEVGKLIEGLIAQGDKAPDDSRRETLHILAARCLTSSVVIDDHVDSEVASRIRAVLPPRSRASVKKLAPLGPYVLPLLPELSTLTTDSTVLVVKLICAIGGSAAVPYARQYAGVPVSAARRELAENWGQFPTDAYAHAVLANMSPDSMLFVENLDQLRLVAHLPHSGTLSLIGDFSTRALVQHLSEAHFKHLILAMNDELHDLLFLKQLPWIAALSVHSGRGITDLSALEGAQLSHLDISAEDLTRQELAPIQKVSGLERLRLVYGGPGRVGHLPPAPADVSYLDITGNLPIDLSTLRDWPSLRRLQIHFKSGTVDLTPLQAITDLAVTVAGRVTIIGGEPFGDRLTVHFLGVDA
ncbi:hypothetical protein QR77_23265 [Streptomyces sp. 150FB]|uniref:NACHT domain-containing protein n=1 Tax=Streptomyces sp. 150FB TaxID=1576605 RepID=UPI000588EAB8|nr:NACHT domain-containing protein [Streptomyces sp. 150FB]KIF76013.1 hypothetical protein QR77_23265 [Streptomyces sp. 150FB]